MGGDLPCDLVPAAKLAALKLYIDVGPYDSSKVVDNTDIM